MAGRGRAARSSSGAAGRAWRAAATAADRRRRRRRRSPARRRAAPAPSTLSYTAIAEYERCPYRYHLQRVLGMADVELPGAGGEEAAAARDVVVHALLERLDFAAPRAAGRAGGGGRRGGGRRQRSRAARIGRRSRRWSARSRAARCARGWRGARDVRTRGVASPSSSAGGELLRGFLDVAGVEADGTLLIVDYKTDRSPADDGRLAALVERDYALQRLVYALAGLRAGAPAVEVAHCFLRRPELVLAARFGARRARARSKRELRGALAPLRAGRFEVSADPDRERCGTCPGRARLCSYDEALTLREAGARDVAASARRSRCSDPARDRLLGFASASGARNPPARGEAPSRDHSQMTRISQPQQADGLYDPRYEHDACGVAVVARLDNVPSQRGGALGDRGGREPRAPRRGRRRSRHRRRRRAC